MSEIRVLDRTVSEQIAAGEVVTRPAAAVKELVENSIDAGATAVTIELVSNGIKSIRITDNGCGIPAAQVKLAFLRHATSKLRQASQLESIGTLGFRGEALPSIAAVSRLRIITRTAEQELGVEYRLDGGEERSFSEIGCAEGTTIYVDDIFYNMPARMKFLKKDVSEGNAVSQTVEELALAYPNVSFKLVRDGKQAVFTPGTGLQPAMFAVFPRALFSDMLPISFEKDGYIVDGYVSAPQSARASRGFQYIYVNARFVKNKTITAAAEEAYKSFSHKGLFPAFVIAVSTDPTRIDVNIHPAKTEVRFSNEREVFSAVYSAVRSAILQYASAPMAEPVHQEDQAGLAKQPAAPAGVASFDCYQAPAVNNFLEYEILKKIEIPMTDEIPAEPIAELHQIEFVNGTAPQSDFHEYTAEQITLDKRDGAYEAAYIGQAFTTYIILQTESELVFVDKHAAHERYLYEKFDAFELVSRQILLDPIVVELDIEQKSALLQNRQQVEAAGFLAEEFGEKEVIVREIPMFFDAASAKNAVEEIAYALAENGVTGSPLDRKRIIQSVSCRAAVKAGDKTSDDELIALARKVLCGEIPKYCPHGRPLYFTLPKKEIEKRFDRA